jgi:hypothetical protein
VKLKRTRALAATDTAMVRTDPTADALCWAEGEGLKGCARRTGKPAVALDPLALTPRLVEMPFRTGVSADGRDVISSAHRENS